VKLLKRIRVVTAVFFLLSISALFLDYRNMIPEGVYRFFSATQIVPSLIRAVTAFGLISIGALLVLLLTVFFGRVYCSAVCPLGIFQDVIIRLSQKINRRRRFKFKKPFYNIHYSLFALTAVSLISGSALLLNLLEPFSNYGRMLSNLVNPVIIVLNNLAANALEHFEIYALFKVPIIHISLVSVIAPAIFFALIFYLSYYHGRLFCNLLCPAGALLGLLSRFSVFKIAIENDKCIECGKCERVCKAGCLDSDSKKIDFAACIGCFNCMDACPTAGMIYRRHEREKDKSKKDFDDGRRILIKTSILPVLGFLLPGILKSENKHGMDGNNQKGKEIPISPPGSEGIERFSNLCTACHVCIDSCPTQVLYPSFLEYGVTGIFQPRMNYSVSYCNYDCVLCTQICPTGAILPVTKEEKKTIQIGQARFIKENCVVVTNQRDCGACSEHCPTKAVFMIPYGDLSLPHVNDEICVGCGACENACPAEPEKAIIVISNREHRTAKRPVSKKLAPSFDESQDFPF
jgi:ferredoxin